MKAVATALGIAVVVEIALAAVLLAAARVPTAEIVDGNNLAGAIAGLSAGAVGTIVVRRTPQHALGWVFVVIGQSEGLATLGWAYTQQVPDAQAAAWIGAYAWIPGFAMFFGLVTLLFPDGRARWRPLVWAAATFTGLGTAVAFTLDAPMAGLDPRWHNPLAIGGAWEEVGDTIAQGLLAAAFGCGLIGAVLLAVRMVRATGSERRRLAWFFVAVTLAMTGSLVPGGPLPNLIATAFFPIGLGIAMVRHRLFDGDRLLNRTLVYAVLTLLVAGVFGLAVGLASSALGGPGVGAVLAAVVIALGLDPARAAVQHGVDRLLYGRRRDPYQALTDLGRRLSVALAPEQVLPIVVRTVAEALRRPYVAVTLEGDTLPTASHGVPTADVDRLPLRHAGVEVGVLTIGARITDPDDKRLLLDFVRQAGVAAHAVRLAHELRSSRDRLLVAREEERHRIRRDLHDQLGPTLAGVALGLGAARRTATSPEAAELLDRLESEVKGGLEDVKRLLADLRPTSLDQLGLAKALRHYGETVTARGQVEVSVEVRDDLALAPEVEVAVYRIVLEAVTNVTRHAAATHCVVAVTTVADSLHLSVRDDGVGLPAATESRGLGLTSMCERVQELGGRCGIESPSGGGTLLSASLPLTRPS
ncbi:hypothetical protein GCM10022226_39290 [Sphaerisporangium flaviroseum]|uniref:Oxygen sensor histidine kinase NreB n=1 Tax=Sphaerisporangium flaviroseum TaxID=509199 RepID=A0ABP7IBU6_9ACTN